MKQLLKAIANAFNTRKKLKEANAYIDYLDEEVIYLRKYIDTTLTEVAKVKNKNDKASTQIKSLRATAGELRERLHSNGATETELKFLACCVDIYRNGKMISEMRFKAMVAAMTEERQGACINRHRVAEGVVERG